MRPRGPATAVARPSGVVVARLVGDPQFRLGQVLWEEGDGERARVRDPAGRGGAQGATRLFGGGARFVLGTVVRSRRHRANGARTLSRGVGMLMGASGLKYLEYKR